MKIEVKQIINSPVDSNCFILYIQNNANCIIVDPGAEYCNELLKFIKDRKISPEYIILTHEHFDHIWGVNQLKNLFPCKVISSAICSEHMIDAKKNLSAFYNQSGFKCCPADITIESINNELLWNGVMIDFFNTPGHTDGSISFYFYNNLFCGDLLIKDFQTVTKLPGGNKNQLKNSLDLVFSKFYNKNIIVYSGHGNPFLLKDIDINFFVNGK
ncbi:MAG: MBL fold metallo-hydrolase [Bacteroidales bacterium]|jgi:glyoxylase-like metal-dependent hydrolase (beta-lactamase superfamily II)|nr:MBL fold metallo-hydrolase [Bacteroidales bacterium]